MGQDLNDEDLCKIHNIELEWIEERKCPKCINEKNKIAKKLKKWLLMHHKDGAKQLFIWATEKFDKNIINEETFNNTMEEVDRIKDAINFIEQLEVKR